MSIDPVTLELVKNDVESVVDEMALTIMRTAYSMNLKSSNDLSSAYCSLDGELLAQGFTLPMQLGSIPDAMAALEATHDLSQVLLRQQPLGLHRLEDLAPTLVALLLRRDLVEGQRRRRIRRGALRLTLEERLGDLLLPRRELSESPGAGRLRPRADRNQPERHNGAKQHSPQSPHSLPHVIPPLRSCARPRPSVLHLPR